MTRPVKFQDSQPVRSLRYYEIPLVALIRLYRRVISPLKARHRFHPLFAVCHRGSAKHGQGAFSIDTAYSAVQPFCAGGAIRCLDKSVVRPKPKSIKSGIGSRSIAAIGGSVFDIMNPINQLFGWIISFVICSPILTGWR